MENEKNSNSFKKLLDRLQEDSWQLELLISGFAIFGLFYLTDPLYHYFQNARLNDNEMAIGFYRIAILSVYILIFNLFFHVLLRALWIGSLGLRYVSGEIEYDKLNYSEKFTTYLKKKVGSFDDYISKLENLSSLMFAISFLLIFYVIAFFIIVYINNTIGRFIGNSSDVWIITVLIIFQTLFILGALFTFIDFLTQGLLKKNKRVSKIYFPFYRVFSILTLSFLYRPLVYNLQDNRFGRRISLLLFPVYFLIFLLSTMYFQTSNVLPLPSLAHSDKHIATISNYEDAIRNNDELYIEYFAIQSKIITDPFIKVIIPLRKNIEEPLIEFYPDLKWGEDIHGYHSGFQFSVGLWKFNYPARVNIDSLSAAYINAFKNYYRFKIDSISLETDFIITKSDDNLTFETYIGTKDLPEGKHFIEFFKRKHKDTDSLVSIIQVPFWYYVDNKKQ